jgi:hypothetical protein
MKTFLWISLSVFLFILFFQPFPLQLIDFNNRLLFVAGMGGIIFVMLIFTRSFFPRPAEPGILTDAPPRISGILATFILLSLSSLAFAFYLRYVGLVEITFHLMFKVVFICLVPPVAMRLCDVFKDLKFENQQLKARREAGSNNYKKNALALPSQPIEFISENSTENLLLLPEEVAFIKSADNYVEVGYYLDDFVKKQLLRNTLKNIEEQLQAFPDFARCHRSCIVNIRRVEKLDLKNQSSFLIISGYDEPIPVSRQYLLKIKERI